MPTDKLPTTQESLPIEIVELNPDQWEVLRDMKIKSLGREPVAFEDQEFGLKKYKERTEAVWREILQGKRTEGKEGISITILAKVGDEYIGMVSVVANSNISDTATIHHMYVDKDYRGRGIGKKLLQGIIEKIKKVNGIKKVELTVVDTQEPAIGLYRGLGFRDKKEKEGVKRGGKDYQEINMELVLNSDLVE